MLSIVRDPQRRLVIYSPELVTVHNPRVLIHAVESIAQHSSFPS
jgi:hypothetical protein